MSSAVQESRKRFYVYARAPLVELTAEAIVELFRGDARARKELAELLISEPDIRLAIINAVLRDVATKSDIEALRAAVKDDIKALKEDMERRIEELRSEFRRELDSVHREIDFLAREIDRLYRLVMVSVLGILISIATTILVRVLLPP
jgi:ABC-type phosphate transport system auxiliary subunit